jgi:hypothetical protein
MGAVDFPHFHLYDDVLSDFLHIQTEVLIQAKYCKAFLKQIGLKVMQKYHICNINITFIGIARYLLKGLCQEMNIFSGSQYKIGTFCTWAGSFCKFCFIVDEIIKLKVLAFSFEIIY